MYRFFFTKKYRIYFPYYSLLNTHPFFSRYHFHPPLKYSNYSEAQLAHWINRPETGLPKIKCVIEPNDHPLAVTGISEPIEVLQRIGEVIDIYSSDNCKKILLSGEGQLILFKRYLPSSLVEKTTLIPLGAIPKQVNFSVRRQTVVTPIFLCLASDYSRKAVDLLIEAWIGSIAKNYCQLILACPNVPNAIESILLKNNIQLIKKAPLTNFEKSELLKRSHVVIAPLHTDGGANVIEAFEYGLPVITMRSQRTFVTQSSGWVVDVPFYFYDSGYGVEWRTWEEFWAVLDSAKANGNFDSSIESLARTIDRVANSPDEILMKGQYAHSMALGPLSLATRNAELNKIYDEILH